MEDQGTVRTETESGVRSIIFSRPAHNNSLTFHMCDELMRALDAADADPEVHVILLRSEGPNFCGGWGLDWNTKRQAEISRRERAWDSVEDFRYISRHHNFFMKFWYAQKPTISAVQGFCVAGGSDLVLCTDIIIAAEGASFGYPPSRVWGTPLTGMWVYRMGLERAKRYLLTGDEIPACEAARIGLILEAVPNEQLQVHAMALARRMAQVPSNQLLMLKLLCNETLENMGFASTRTLGRLFDGIARHTQEGLDFITRAEAVGFRQAVRERDDPFGDYGSRRRQSSGEANHGRAKS
jgi:enoyl-CoA hydratase